MKMTERILSKSVVACLFVILSAASTGDILATTISLQSSSALSDPDREGESTCIENHFNSLSDSVMFMSTRRSHLSTCPLCRRCRTKPRTASYYTALERAPTANGEGFHRRLMRAAVHTCEYNRKKGKCYELTANDSSLKMCYNGNKVVVRINDSGPAVSPGGFDLTIGAFDKLLGDCGEDLRSDIGRIPVTNREVVCPAF